MKDMKEKIRKAMSFIRRNKVTTKVISCVLSLVLVFYVIPSSIYAEAAELFSDKDEIASDGLVSDESAVVGTTAPSRDILLTTYEDEALREESVKHFHLSDGSYVAAQYTFPVHYIDESGEWQDIDNALADSGSEYANNNARIKFAKKITGNESLFTLHDGNTKITLSLVGAKKGTLGAVTNNSDSEEETELQKMMNLEKLSSKILYADILDGIDLEYVAYSHNVKENIIVKERRDSYSYTFSLKLNGLTPTLTESGDIQLADDGSGEIKYTIPGPVVYDSAGALAPADKASYTLTHEGGKKYTLTVSADASWMNAEDRVFPVTVDPAIFCGLGGILDLNIDSTSPNTNNDGEDSLYVTSTQRSYLKFNPIYFSSIPLGSTIIKAELNIIGYKWKDISPTVGVYEITSDWDNTLTWNKTISDSPEGTFGKIMDYITVTNNGSRYNFDITYAYRKWVSGAENYGIGLRLIDESDDQEGAYFVSYEYMPPDDDGNFYEPAIIVSYVHSGGLEGYWSYSSHSAGIAGSGSINLANGNLVFAIPTLTTTDGIFGYTPTLYYNSYLAGKDYTYANTKTAYSSSYMPYGFKLNICETIIDESYTTVDNTTAYQYIHADADGTEHAYLSSGVSGTYYDEDGLGKTLTVETHKIEITDDSHITKRFYELENTPNSSVLSAWYLAEIEDVAGNKLIFNFDSAYRPISVNLRPAFSTSNILLMTLFYTSDGKLCAVYDHGTQNAVVLKYSATYNGSVVYSGGKYLRYVEYCYLEGYQLGDIRGVQDIDCYANGDPRSPTIDSIAEYYYDSTGRLTWVADSYTRHGIIYSWDNNRVESIFEEADQELGKSIDIEYLVGATDVYSAGNDNHTRTDDDIVTRYVFDSYGRAVSKYSTSYDRKEIYGATVGVYGTQENSKNSLTEKTVVDLIKPNLLANSNFTQIASNGSFEYWTKSSNVNKNAEIGIGLSQPDAIAFAPTVNSDAFVYQDVTLNAGDYTLSVPYLFANCDGVQGFAQIINPSTGAILFSEQSELNASNKKMTEKFVLTFSLAAKTTVRIKLMFRTLSAPSEYMSVCAGLIKLEEGHDPSVYSPVNYGGVDNNALLNNSSSDTLIEYWTYSEHTAGAVTVKDGRECMSILSGLSERYIKQTVYEASAERLAEVNRYGYNSSSEPDDSFVVSGFAKAPDAVSSKAFGIRVDITYYKGEGENDYVSTYYFAFVPGCTDWQFTSGMISIGKEQDSSYVPTYLCVKSIEIFLDVSYQPQQIVYFDDISLVYSGENQSVSNEFNEDGKLVCSTQGKYIEYYEYNDDGNISRIANCYGELWDYEYTFENPNLLGSVSEYSYTYGATDGFIYPYWANDPDNLIEKELKKTTSYEYNYYGQIVCVITTDASDASIFTKETYEYNNTFSSKLFGLILTEQSRADSKTKYFYEDHSGRLLASINVNSGRGYVYTYDEMGRLLEVNPANYTASTDTYTANTSAEYVEYEYGSDKRLYTVITAGTEYNFSYDEFGNTTEIEAGNSSLATYEYDDYNGKLKKVTYGNSFYTEYVYNDKEQLTEVKYNGSVRYKYEYTASGQMFRLHDLANETVTVYYYDQQDKFVGFRELSSETNEELFASSVKYNDKDLLSEICYEYDYNLSSASASDSVKYSYIYLDDGLIKREDIESGDLSYSVVYSYDTLDRIYQINYNVGSNGFSNIVNYTYKSDATYGESALVSTYTSKVGNVTTSYNYTYDPNGNITRITYQNGDYITYTYDDIGQLTREYNVPLNKIYTYTYDNAGNITAVGVSNIIASGSGGEVIIKSIGDDSIASPNALLPSLPGATITTVNYTYSDSAWGDLLTSYDGHAITYDEIGNPLSYYNGTSYTFTWNGRRLVGATKGNMQMSFAYNDEGLRTSKTVNGVTTNYYYDGSLLIKEETPTYTTVYIYDINGSPIGFKSRKSTYADGVWDAYYYEKNLQGDITKIRNSSGTILATYKYNAWGDALRIFSNGGATTTVDNNHLTYRGYYYDYDLGMYYLQSRYYDQKVGRFINADGSLYNSMHGYNLFVYCNNNPVNYVDYTGKSPFAMLIASNPAVAAATLLLITAFVFLAYDATHDQTLSKAFWDAIDGTNTNDAVEQKEPESQKTYTVYRLVDPLTQKTEYVGRTSDPVSRENAHKNSVLRGHLTFIIIESNLDKETARGLEQYYMNYYHTKNTENKMNNQINGISPTNPKAIIYFQAALKYFENQVSNEFLNWAGK